MTKPSVFITGATGLLGSHLVRLLLLKGYTRITAIRRGQSSMALLGADAARIHWIEGDVLDIEALESGMRDAEWVFHCAGYISFDPRHVSTLHSVNKEGTENVVNAALRCGVKHLLHMSSVSVLSRLQRHDTIDESRAWQRTRYTSQYGLSKHLAEMEVQRGIAEGLKASIVIPSIILGAGVWQEGSATVFHRVGQGMPVYPGGNNGFVDVRDVCALALAIMEQDLQCRVIANGHMITYKKLFSEIARRIDAAPPRILFGPLAAEVLWRLFVPVRWITGRQPVINKHTVRMSQCTVEYRNSASLAIEGFRYTPLGKTLDDIATQYRSAREKKFAPAFLEYDAEF